MKKKKRGRPKVDNGHNAWLPGVRVSKDQLAKYHKAANAADKPFAGWVRAVLDLAAE